MKKIIFAVSAVFLTCSAMSAQAGWFSDNASYICPGKINGLLDHTLLVKLEDAKLTINGNENTLSEFTTITKQEIRVKGVRKDNGVSVDIFLDRKALFAQSKIIAPNGTVRQFQGTCTIAGK